MGDMVEIDGRKTKEKWNGREMTARVSSDTVVCLQEMEHRDSNIGTSAFH